MSGSISRWFGDWRHLVEKPISAEEVERAVERGSIPVLSQILDQDEKPLIDGLHYAARA